MKQITHPPGSPEWHANRAECFNASDVAAALGCSTHTTRTQLLDALVAGKADPGAFQQRILDSGHQFEALARPLGEKIIGEELFVYGGTLEVDGLSRPLGASFDGITMAEDILLEHKRLNEAIAEALPVPGLDPDSNDAAALPKMYRAQMEQQLLVSGAERDLFLATDWKQKPDGEWELQDARCCWYESDPALRAELIAGWKQVDVDLARHVPVVEAPKPVPEAIEALPALLVQIEGRVLNSNLPAYQSAALALISRINTDLQTDQDFANAESMVKFCKDGEERLDVVKQQALAQTASIEELFRTIDTISAQLRAKRLELDRLVKARKEAIRLEIVQAGIDALAAHVMDLNQTIGRPYMPKIEARFREVISGKKTVASLRNAMETELARCKIVASEAASRILKNLQYLREHAAAHVALFPDTATIVLKEPEDLASLVKARIAEHQAAEQRRAAELAERERDRIRAEEAARLQREQQEREALERRQREEAAAQERRQREAAAAPQAETVTPPVAPATTLQQVAASMPTTVVPMPTRPAARAATPTLALGVISERIGFTVTAAFLEQLGFPVAKVDRGAKLYFEDDFGPIVDALVNHLTDVREQHQLQAA